MTQAPNSTQQGSTELTAAELGDLMQSVMETAERLQSTHGVLQDQVQRLERELAEANAQLHRSRELASLGEMAAGIAHEIRNPLASIQLYAEVLAEDLASRPEQAEVCQKIDRSVRRMDVIVRDVLQFARESTVRFEDMPASALIERVVGSCGDSASSVQVSIGMDPAVRVDPSLMLQALGNIVRNGLESMEHETDGGRLEIGIEQQRLRCPDGQVRSCTIFRVEDRGCGIPEPDQERLFNPFFTTRASGTGLGLAIAHRVVDAHGGHIHVSNRSGGGTRFDVCVPAPVGHENIASSDGGTCT
ncbi:MAG: ATP-binding protein [Phycisphaerales bacterium]|nr:ATP-binding protein [Phycisphaerales bacterium]